MNNILFFVLGLLVGTSVGFSIMCLVSINKITDYEREIKRLQDKKKEVEE